MVRFIIGNRNGKVKVPACHFGDMLVETATRHGRLGSISVGGRRRRVCGFSLAKSEELYGTEEAGGRHDMGVSNFCSSLFGDLEFSLQKMFAGRGPKIWLAVRNS